jgi:uncharacterized repeat protein (TIGR03806 family)
MRRLILPLALAAVMLSLSFFGPKSAADAPDKKPVGIDKRTPWTTSHVQGSPEPPALYRPEVAFPKLPPFAEPLDMAYLPGGDRLAVAERRGKIFTFVNDPKTENADLLLHIKEADQIYAITFHPQFAKNGYLYVTYIIGDNKPTGTRVSRFVVKGDPPAANPANEKIVFEWPSGGHNAGCLKFGPDGFLYIGTGDGSGIADEHQTGQDLSDVRAKILRIDVDRPDEGKSYGIPKDNPFVDRAGTRPEVWAYGVRQPWKMSFDRGGGDFWVGEVGQDLWESVHRIQKGGNYGWSVKEGSHDFRPDRKKGPDPILPPVQEHSHADFRSLTGGYVYRGDRLKDLVGAYVYGDFDTGRVWRLRPGDDKEKRKVEAEELCQTALRIVSFGEDRAGELYLLDFAGGRVHRLAPAERRPDAPPFPRKLSETGLFESTKELKPAPGLIPYTVNAQLWSDGATKERYLALPGESRIDFDAVVYPYGDTHPGHPRGWRFPDGTVAVKTFFLDLEPGNPAARRRLETRLLHFEQRPGTEEYGDGYWRGYTYEWDDDQADAVLVDRAGKDRAFTIKGKDGDRKQTWHFPSRSECTGCHTMPAKYVLGVNTLQINRDHDYGGGRTANQLRTLEHLGVFKAPLPKPPEELPHLTDYSDPKQPLEARARAYLHANCAHCHMKWGGGNAEFELLAPLDLKATRLLTDKPQHGKLGLDDPALLVPGAPERSLILKRMKTTDATRMPRIASSVVDEEGVKIVEEWIKEMR